MYAAVGNIIYRVNTSNVILNIYDEKVQRFLKVILALKIFGR